MTTRPVWWGDFARANEFMRCVEAKRGNVEAKENVNKELIRRESFCQSGGCVWWVVSASKKAIYLVTTAV